MRRPPPRPTLFPYTTLFRSVTQGRRFEQSVRPRFIHQRVGQFQLNRDAHSTGRMTARAPPCQIEKRSKKVEQIRSEEHTSELQSHSDLVCRLLLEKKKKKEH